MVLAAGATLQFGLNNRLVIDAGTCVTFDFIDEVTNTLEAQSLGLIALQVIT
jgi:type III pantothenate kinase